MLSLMPFTPRYAIFYAIYPKLCYRLCHIPRSSAIFFLNIMLQYITLTPSYANSSYAMISGQSWGRILGYCCKKIMFSLIFFQTYFEWPKAFILLYTHSIGHFLITLLARSNPRNNIVFSALLCSICSISSCFRVFHYTY